MKKAILCAAALIGLASSPVRAGSIAGCGAWWDTDDTGDAFGYGGRITLEVMQGLDIELRGLRFEGLDDKVDLADGSRAKVKFDAMPVDIGIAMKYVSGIRTVTSLGGGISYPFYDSDQGSLESKTGWYGSLTVEVPIRGALSWFTEVIYRDIELEIAPGDLDDLETVGTEKINLGSFGTNFGLSWLW